MGDGNPADEMEDRLIDFSVRIIRLVDKLPRSQVGKHIGNQLLRSGTSAAPNYAEARGAESKRDFAHKLGIALKEMNETSVWLRVLTRAQLVKPELLSNLVDETQQLCRILNASVKTAKKNNDK